MTGPAPRLHWPGHYSPPRFQKHRSTLCPHRGRAAAIVVAALSSAAFVSDYRTMQHEQLHALTRPSVLAEKAFPQFHVTKRYSLEKCPLPPAATSCFPRNKWEHRCPVRRFSLSSGAKIAAHDGSHSACATHATSCTPGEELQQRPLHPAVAQYLPLWNEVQILEKPAAPTPV